MPHSSGKIGCIAHVFRSMCGQTGGGKWCAIHRVRMLMHWEQPGPVAACAHFCGCFMA
jgi:hypothetical protein